MRPAYVHARMAQCRASGALIIFRDIPALPGWAMSGVGPPGLGTVAIFAVPFLRHFAAGNYP